MSPKDLSDAVIVPDMSSFDEDTDSSRPAEQSLEQVANTLGFTSGKAQKTKIGELLQKRRCHGILCLIFFFVIVAILIVINATQDYNDSYEKSTSFATSTDKQRRICGTEQ